MPPNKSDAFSVYDSVLNGADLQVSPWHGGKYFADLDLLHSLLVLTLGAKQQSGRTAKALDAWIAHELRRAGFEPDTVWPRTRRPRVLPADLADVERAVDDVVAAAAKQRGVGGSIDLQLRRAIRSLDDARLGDSDSYILGDFYAKQVDVVISSWRRGPELLVSTKTMFSSYRNNFKNRHEEAVGEVATLRRRHPMAAMGFAFLVRANIYEGAGDFALLRNILARLRRPQETFDATMLLVAEWDDADPAGSLSPIDAPDEALGPARFFEDLLDASIERTPVGEHEAVRHLRDGEPARGGAPAEGAAEIDDLDEERELDL